MNLLQLRPSYIVYTALITTLCSNYPLRRLHTTPLLPLLNLLFFLAATCVRVPVTLLLLYLGSCSLPAPTSRMTQEPRFVSRFAWAWSYDVIDYDCAPSELHIPRTLSHSTHDPIRGDSQKSRHHLRRKDCISFSSSDLISHFLMMHVSHNINISIIIPMCYVFSTFNHRHVF